MLVTVPVEQLLSGFVVEETRCSYCKATLQEGESVSAYVVRYAGDHEWSIPRLYCDDCHPTTITDPTLGATELLVRTRLTRTMDVTMQQSSFSLLDIQSVVQSYPEEGHATL